MYTHAYTHTESVLNWPICVQYHNILYLEGYRNCTL